jgi:ribosomal protein S18 acetylase RimI-like enzyme
MRRGCRRLTRRLRTKPMISAPVGYAIRQAVVADAAAVAHVHCESWRSTYPGLVPQRAIDDWANLEARTNAWTAVLTAQKSSVWVCEQAGAVVGFACVGSASAVEHGLTGQLFALYLQRNVQRRGIGDELTRTALRHLHATGHNSVRVEVLRGNQPAIAFYERMGATRRSEAPFEMSGSPLTEFVYGWDDIGALIR